MDIPLDSLGQLLACKYGGLGMMAQRVLSSPMFSWWYLHVVQRTVHIRCGKLSAGSKIQSAPLAVMPDSGFVLGLNSRF